MCGVLIYIAVAGHEKTPYPLGKVIFCFLAVAVFIISSHEHCIANAAYYALAGAFNAKVVLYFIIMILGNAIGSIGFDGLLKVIDWLNKKPEIEEQK